MKLDESIQSRREMILQIARRHGVGQVRVFGSVARGETTENSDLDLLIDVTGPTPPWFPGGLVAELEALLGRRVDVVETDALRKELRDRVLQEAAPL
jgi:predicted nucleotidyltransferase